MKLRLLIISISAVACIHTAPVPSLGDWIASDSSQYSPVAHFLAHTTLAADGIHIAIDSGSVYVPGVLVPDSPALMSGLSLTAILAVPDSGSLAIVQPAQGRAAAERRAWRPVASSDSAPLVDVLHYGERVQLPPIRLRIPTAKTPEGVAWIIYRISGTGVES
jgi:hypothetical protein